MRRVQLVDRDASVGDSRGTAGTEWWPGVDPEHLFSRFS